MKRVFTFFALSAFALACPNIFGATVITYYLHGTITTVDQSFASQFAPGQQINISYSFNSAVAARAGSTFNSAYFDALTSISLSVGSYSAAGKGAPEVQVDNNFGVHNSDTYKVVSRASQGLWDPLESTCRHASLSIL